MLRKEEDKKEWQKASAEEVKVEKPNVTVKQEPSKIEISAEELLNIPPVSETVIKIPKKRKKKEPLDVVVSSEAVTE